MNRKRIIALAVAVSQAVSCVHTTPPPPAAEATSVTPHYDARNPSAEDPWTNWSSKNWVSGLLALKKIRDNLFSRNLHDPHVDYSGYAPVSCNKKESQIYRTADGTCNDLKRPHAGAAGVAFGRNIPPAFIDKESDKKIMSPNPSQVSEVFFTRDEFKPVPFLNMLAASWIQFMNHDWLTHGKNAYEKPFQVKQADGSVKVVDRTQDNKNKSKFKSAFHKVTLNDVTHWWDASQLYGSSYEEQKALRSFSGGKMRTEMHNGRELLPKRTDLNVASNRQNQGYEETGFKDNWWIGLSVLHTLFVKEHNAIADMLRKTYVVSEDTTRKLYKWKEGKVEKLMSEKDLDEHLFQLARLTTSAILAKIHTVEWTPAILPNPVLIRGMCANWYGLGNPKCLKGELGLLPDKTDSKKLDPGYLIGGIVGDKAKDYGVPFSITEEFTSVYRLHSLLPEMLHLKRYGKSGVTKVDFNDTRNEKSYDVMADYDLKDLYYSFGTQHPGQLVLNNFPKFMQEFTIPGHPTMDLGMVDVLRDRERGVPRYNQFRRAIGLKAITSYEDFFRVMPNIDSKEKARREKVVQKFRSVYGQIYDAKAGKAVDNVEMIDLLVGTLAEEVRPESFGFGETMFQIFILMATRRLTSDRFFTDYYTAQYYTEAGLKWIDEATMASVIVRHMPELKANVEGLPTAFSPWKK